MVSISALYDTANERYPIYYTGILVFVITVCLPLNLGVSNLPTVEVFLLFGIGFLSLFMITRNKQVGFGLLTHLKIPSKEMNIDQKSVQEVTHQETLFTKSEWNVEDPFGLLQNVVERIIINHDDHMDLATRVRLERMSKKLQNMSK